MSTTPETPPGFANVEKSSLPLWSLILAIASFPMYLLLCSGLFVAIAAVICGHLALSKIAKSGGVMPGKGQATAGLITGYCSLACCLLIMPALLLPALAKAKEKAVKINCVNNLKQVGLAARLWSGDHNDNCPWLISTNNGGTLELCNQNKAGVDNNSALHFQIMSNELNTPKILVCPADKTKTEALDFNGFTAANVSYILCTGKEVNERDPSVVMAYCPVHGNVLFADGSVQQLSRKSLAAFLKGVNAGQNPTEALRASGAGR